MRGFLRGFSDTFLCVACNFFMSVSNQVREWLHIALTEQVDRINESYFFDRQDSEFYSVFITDYFLTDPNSANDFPNSPYSKDEIAILSARMDRQENNDPSIVIIPRLTVEERKEMLQTFLDQHLECETRLLNVVDIENGRTNLDFDNLLPTDLKEKWQEFKWHFIQSKVDSFSNLYNIDLETVSLWTDKKMTTMNLDLKDTEEQEVVVKKPWWKFW